MFKLIGLHFNSHIVAGKLPPMGEGQQFLADHKLSHYKALHFPPSKLLGA